MRGSAFMEEGVFVQSSWCTLLIFAGAGGHFQSGGMHGIYMAFWEPYYLTHFSPSQTSISPLGTVGVEDRSWFAYLFR